LSVQILDPKLMDMVHLEWNELALFAICTAYLVMDLKPMSKIMSKLSDDFIYGLLAGFFLVMYGIVTVQGLYSTLANYQVHYVTLMWLDAAGLWFYYNQPKDRVVKKKVLFTFLFVLWFFEAHDIFWLLQVLYTDTVWLAPTLIVHPDWIWFSIAFSRYVALTVPLTYLLRKEFHVNKKVLAFLSVQIVYHIIASYTNYPLNFITLIPDTLPSLFLVWKRKDKEKPLIL